MLWYIIAFVLGGWLGVFIMAALVAASRSDEDGHP